MLRAPALLCVALLLGGAAKTTKKKPKKTPPPPAAPAGPAWAAQGPRFVNDAQGRAFVAPGRSDDDRHPEAAEDDARQGLGGLVAKWQEEALRCAKQASESKVVSASSMHEKGATLDITVESATTVALYDEKAVDRGVQGKTALVLMRHDLPSMIDGIEKDPQRTENLKTAVKVCGEKAFDTLAK